MIKGQRETGTTDPGKGGFAMPNRRDKQNAWSWWYLIFIGLFFVSLWVPVYNRIEPTFIGLPFFYWFQILLILIGAVLTAVVYFATEA
ncbi:MAG: DUF3311 domain-containing protein [Stellaceae bacterium]